MCGITGMLHPGADARSIRRHVERMAQALRHRGPDGEGRWADENAGLHLAHRRLAVVDLTEHGRQPMQSATERYVIVYNGEVYNHRELREELKENGTTFVGTSDTEVILAAFERWGIRPTLQRCTGMFALAVWDRDERVLTLARDRLGEKPLHYGHVAGAFVFASELKAITAIDGFCASIDRAALSAYFRYACIPAPLTIWEGIQKVPPGTLVTVSEDGVAARPVPYWSALDAVQRAGTESTSEDETLVAMERLLQHTISDTLLADVPVGVLLSGGIDSSLIAALAQAHSKHPIKTFTIGFEEASHDESQDARRIARHLGTEHHELRVPAQAALDAIGRLARVYDEPFADSSQIPTLLVCEMARRHVTVVLGGDGGDEVFGGYNRYTEGARLHARLTSLPTPVRNGTRALLTRVPTGVLEAIRPLVAPRSRRGQFAHKARKLGFSLGEDAYAAYTRCWHDNDNPAGPPPPPPACAGHPNLEGAAHMMLHDTLSYLPDDILTKVDRAAMAVSLEVRAPLLSHHVFEAAWRLPADMRIREGKGKWILREILARHIPRALFERPKTGFSIPLAEWLRGPLRAWADDLLAPDRLNSDGYLDADAVTKKWIEHQGGRHDWHAQIWTVLVFQMWLHENRHHIKQLAKEITT